MNLSLKQRIVLSYVVAVFSILILTFVSFFYLEDLSVSLNKIIFQLKSESIIVNEVTSNYLKIRQDINNYLKKDNLITVSDLDDAKKNLRTLDQQLKKNNVTFTDPAMQETLGRIAKSINQVTLLTEQFLLTGKSRKSFVQETLNSQLDSIWGDFNKLFDSMYQVTRAKEQEISDTIRQIKRMMLIVLIIGFLGLILVAMIIPARVTFPIKKISDAIKELQDCNFDVSIYYNRKDEMGELAEEINKMIKNLKMFEELRAERNLLELRKFDILANSVKKYIIMTNSKGEISYINNSLYSILGLSSEDLLHKNIRDSLLPKSVVESFDLATKRRTKVENAEVIFQELNSKIEEHYEAHKLDVEQGGVGSKINEERIEDLVSSDNITTNIIFSGYANIFPIRGKTNSNDYYLMVISKEVLV